MAKNIGLIQFEGSLGDLVGYTRNGKLIIQRKGGFDGARVKTEERYAAVRQRQTEFGKCAKISSVIKRSLSWWLQWVPGTMVYNHIQSMVVAVKNCDVLSEKGAKTFEKGIKTEAGALLFKKFQLHAKRSLRAGLSVEREFDFETGTVQVRALQYKLTAPVQLGAQLVVLQMDLDTYESTLVPGAVQFLDTLNTSTTLTVEVPVNSGFVAVFLFIGKCTVAGATPVWLRDAEVGFGVLDFKFT